MPGQPEHPNPPKKERPLFEHVTRDRSWRQRIFPKVTNLVSAEYAIMFGVGAAVILAVISTVIGLAQLNPAILLNGVTWALITWGIRRRSRFAAIGAVLYLSLTLVIQGGFDLMAILVGCAFFNSIRGTFGYHKFHAQLRATRVVEGHELAPDHLSTIQSLQVLEPGETIRYFYSDTPWDITEQFYMLTDRSLIGYLPGNGAPFGNVFRLPFNEIVIINVDYADSPSWHSQVFVSIMDMALLEEEMPSESIPEGATALEFPLSPEGGGDRRFVRALEEATGVKSSHNPSAFN